jgi:hypothetical protein
MTFPLSHFCLDWEQHPHPFRDGFRLLSRNSLSFLWSALQFGSWVCLSLTLSPRPQPRRIFADAPCRDRGNLPIARGHFVPRFVALAPTSTPVDPIVSNPNQLDVLWLSGEDGRKTPTQGSRHARHRSSLFPCLISDFWSLVTRCPRPGFSFHRICELPTPNCQIPAHP